MLRFSSVNLETSLPFATELLRLAYLMDCVFFRKS
jgi:hypothetical protein